MYKSLSIAISLGVYTLINPISASAINLSFTPNSSIAKEGDRIDVDITFSDLSGELDSQLDFANSDSLGNDLELPPLSVTPDFALGTFDLVVGFDDRILDYDRVTFGNFLNPSSSILGTTQEIFTPPNSLRLLEISGELPSDLVTSQPDSFTLATVSLNAVGLGTSDLVLGDVTLGDENGNSLTAILDSGSVTVEPGITTNTVPESSSTFGILALGMGGLLLISRQKKC